MPGIKRKAATNQQQQSKPSSSKSTLSTNSKKIRSSAKSAASSSSFAAADSDDDDDDFDDDQNLVARALAKDAEADSDSEESSDEDMEGGFEDLENGDADSAGYEDLEDDEQGGFEDLEADEDDQESHAGPSNTSSNKNLSKQALYAAPTNEEMQGLRETGELFKSNILKLQIEEMLSTVRPNYHKAGALELVLRRVRTLFDDIKPIPMQPLADARKTLKKQYPSASVNIPFAEPAPRDEVNYKFGFEPPSGLQLVGSWPLKIAALRPEGLDVDLAIVMPSSLFQEKDHLNFRYFHKRAFYLAVLASALSTATDLGVETEYQLEGSDSRRPILVLRPKKNKADTDFSKLKAIIKIHLAYEADLFPAGRLSPSRNNIRTSSASEEGATETSQPPTPRYNAAVLADSLMSAHLVYLHSTAKACPGFADAAALLKIWAFQRGFGSGIPSKMGGVRRVALDSEDTRFVLTMILAHLLHGEEKLPGRAAHLVARAKLANGFSSYQLFRGVIDWLAHHDFAAQPVFMKPAGVQSRADKISRDDFAHQFDRVLVDPTGSVNLLGNWLSGSVDLLQHEARLTFAMLDDSESDRFDELFRIQKTSPLFTFDDAAQATLPLREPSAQLARLDAGNALSAAGRAVQATLARAMSNRARFSTVLRPASTTSWSLKESQPELDGAVEIGFVYDAALALRLVEHGPAPEDKSGSASFQAFWGDVAELRRFRDGRILLSIVWEISGQSERWGIPRRIVRHVLQRHHSLSSDDVVFDGEAFAGLVDMPRPVAEKAYLALPDEKGFTLVQSAFDGLTKQLRAMDDLPLSLISINASASGLRGMSAFIPAPLNLAALGSTIPDCASHLPAQELVLTFESSGKWPDDLKAIQAMKLAFLERMATFLPSKMPDVLAQVALDANHHESEIQDCASLELVFPAGFAFRARIHHEREKILLDRIVSDKRTESPARREEAGRALVRWERRFVSGPAHHSAMATLQHRYVALGETIRLVKRWLSCQMLDDDLVSPEAVELLATSVFICPGAAVPSSGAAGLVQVLRKLATWQWREEPLLLPLQTAVLSSDDGTQQRAIRFPTERRVEALEQFKKVRSADPSLSTKAWFLALEEDVTSSRWGDMGPSGPIAHAIQQLAKAACSMLGSVEQVDDQLVQALFTPSTKTFDFVLHLQPGVLPRYAQSLSLDPAVWGEKASSSDAVNGKKAFRNRSLSGRSQLGSTPRVDFDPSSDFVRLLRSLYGDSLRLYVDSQGGGSKIGGIFNPVLVQQERRFKAVLGFNSSPVGIEEASKASGGLKEVVLNRRAVLAEMRRLGQGLVERVEVLKEL